MNRLITLKAQIDEYEEKDILSKIMDLGATETYFENNYIIIQCSQKEINNIKDLLKTFKIESFIIQQKIFDTTLIENGIGTDPENSVEVTLLPTTKLSKLKLLEIIFTKELQETKNPDTEQFITLYPPIVRNILKNAGVTDAIFTIKFIDLETDLDQAVKIATINAITNSKGIKEI
jgi:hypothetical protein